MKAIFILFGFLLISPLLATKSSAQELIFYVNIDASQIPDMQTFVIDDMKSTITNLLNNRNWTEDEFKPEERIKCNLVISLVSLPTQYTYTATAQVQVSRPVYGSTYETTLLNYFDKQFNFELTPGQPLNYNENIFSSRLTSLLSFYAYVALSVDYDSFGKLSGSKYTERALNIANIAKESVGEGWGTSDPNNRGALIENLNSQQLIPFREGNYTYHRKGMDSYYIDPIGAREFIYAQLETIKEVSKVKPYAVLLRTFFFSKKDEMINIFKDANPALKEKVVTLLRELDPTNTEKYQAIMKN